MRKGKFLPDWLDSSIVRIVVAVVLILALVFGSTAFLKKDRDRNGQNSMNECYNNSHYLLCN